MLSTFFAHKPIVDDETKQWIFETFAWAIENFELTVFKQETQLILPNNAFYPATVNSVHQMAESIFQQTLDYAGMKKWPIKLVEPSQYQQKPFPKLAFNENLRGDTVSWLSNSDQDSTIYVSYNPNQINQPQDLIASFAQSFSAILIAQKAILPPGGQQYVPQAIDLLSCFMGFGVMLSNTAYQFKGGCGSCFNPYANRNVSLPEREVLFCLALFATLKALPIKQVSPHLKKHLRSDFKHTVKLLSQELKDLPQPALLAAVS